MGPRSRTPSGPAVSTDCINRPDRRLHPTNVTTSNYLLQRGGHPQRTSSTHRIMSAYGGKADIFLCPLFTQKRTFAIVIRMSAKGHNATYAVQQSIASYWGMYCRI